MNKINLHYYYFLFLLSTSLLLLSACQQQQSKQTATATKVNKTTATAPKTSTPSPAKATTKKRRERYKDAPPSAPYEFQGILFEATPFEKTDSYKLNRSVNDPTTAHKRLFYTEGDRRKGGEGLVRDGKPEGVWVWYHEDEKLQKKQEVTFVKGKEQGIQRSWYWNGQQRSEQEYQNGVRHGKRTTWKEDGGLLGKKIYENGEVTHSERH